MAIEAKRGCGYRKVGGLYLVGKGMGVACDRMPYNLIICRVCGGGIKFSRAFTWLRWRHYAGDYGEDETVRCACVPGCPMCHPGEDQSIGLLFVGDKFYTPASFIEEATRMGVSKRIPFVPKELIIGETWVFLAHLKAGVDAEGKDCPAIFYAFEPTRIEKVIDQSDATEEPLTASRSAGITPVIVPDDDPDHHLRKKRKGSQSEEEAPQDEENGESLEPPKRSRAPPAPLEKWS